MKVAVLSESEADEAAVLVWASAIYSQQVERADIPNQIRTRGWAVLNIIHNVVPAVHYHTAADALVFVVDSNGEPVHVPDHDGVSQASLKCRFCQAQRIAQNARARLKPKADSEGRVLKGAIGLAVPCHEAWLQCGRNPQVSEATWIEALENRNKNTPPS